MIRTLIVDDEPLAREGLDLMLQQEQDVQLIGQCSNGADAIQAINELNPDLVLLDIQMPRTSGFDVVRQVGPRQMPFVIFVTAYDEYAVEAFNVQAIDYLLKPVRPSRLRDSLDRVREQILNRNLKRSGERLGQLLDLVGHGAQEERIVVRSHGHVYFLQARQILWVAAEGDYVTIHTIDSPAAGPKSHLLRETMRNMERRLTPHRFQRIHRSAIVNLDCIRELRSNRNNDYSVIMNDGTVLNLGRSYKDALYAALGGVEAF